jgi:hypothetical protein
MSTIGRVQQPETLTRTRTHTTKLPIRAPDTVRSRAAEGIQ